ncbi:hypothetical protein GCM10022216_32140 [Sphingobacterium kyonggiense]|uniref:Capsule synthesis protein CapA domain-containing protein n=1 Tax=Sphingobacterium kyonggiense TaxID=714075 RepID=A0ABP7Z3T1_9SPHI
MVFVGDIAIPHKGAINYSDFPDCFYKKKWYGNLEGAIVNKDNNELLAVYNHEEGITELLEKFNFLGFSLSNNHIFDTGTYEETLNFLKKNNLLFGGIGKSLDEANKEIEIFENGVQIIIINFGWEVIQCEITLGDYKGVNPLRKSHVLSTMSELKKKYPTAKIIPFLHWSYELEGEPQPFERDLAKKLIDMGAAGIIGCHPHRVGGFELYKNKPIVYSLGNWLFKQNHYMGGKLKFPEFCNLQLAFEWDFINEKFQFHFFYYNKITSNLQYKNTETCLSATMKNLTPFDGLDKFEYKKWYKSNHYHKNKGLPVYYWEDGLFLTQVKNLSNKFRDYLLKTLFNKGK